MKCKNPYCKTRIFYPVIELDTNRLVGVKYGSCGARYSTDNIKIKESLKRTGWNSMIWSLKHM